MKKRFHRLALGGLLFTILFNIVHAQPFPKFNLTELHSQQNITEESFSTEEPYYLVNIWGSWCFLCHKELPFLMELSSEITIYGVAWGDSRDDALHFLEKYGNPFHKTAFDEFGEITSALNIYAAPVTLLVSTQREIIYQHSGELNDSIWQKQFVPRMQP